MVHRKREKMGIISANFHIHYIENATLAQKHRRDELPRSPRRRFALVSFLRLGV